MNKAITITSNAVSTAIATSAGAYLAANPQTALVLVGVSLLVGHLPNWFQRKPKVTTSPHRDP